MSLSTSDAAKIAKLARIRMEAKEIEHYTEQLNDIFAWIEQLQEVDVEGIPPMAGVGGYTARVRDDEVTEPDSRTEVLKNAPNAAYDCYTVPKMVE